MSELHDSSLRVRRKRRRRPPTREREEPIPTTPLQRSLLAAAVLLISCSLLLIMGMLNPSGMGAGSLQPSFRVEGGQVTVNNEEHVAWSGVSVEVFGLWSHAVASSNALYEGGSQQIDAGAPGPYVVWVRGAHGGSDGFWFGLVY